MHARHAHTKHQTQEALQANTRQQIQANTGDSELYLLHIYSLVIGHVVSTASPENTFGLHIHGAEGVVMSGKKLEQDWIESGLVQ